MVEEAGPALQVIVLGSGGGPQESNTTAFLVRSVAENWHKGSIIAVDAGVHLSAITRLVREALPSAQPSSDDGTTCTLTTGPFAGLSLPHTSPEANAAHITSTLVDTFLITHPHLDHISGFVINTAAFPATRPRKLAGLPSTIHAFKTHIFNNIIWPNLSDEGNGAGLITYLRLVEGGSPALGDGEGRGYLEVCDGLLVKTWTVSHGHCIEKHSHRGSASSASPRHGSHDGSNQPLRRTHSPHAITRAQSLLSQATLGASSPQGVTDQEKFCVYDSSAYFIQDQTHRREVLIFGDVEPDSISLTPRNLLIWQEAAPKVASGTLAAVFIECSYDDSQSNDRLFGHLKPIFVIEELRVLAAEVDAVRKERSHGSKKRKRASVSEGGVAARRKASQEALPSASEDPVSPKTVKSDQPVGYETPNETPHLATPIDEMSLRDSDGPSPLSGVGSRMLEGLKVVIIHVKARLTDGPDVGDTILKELEAYETEAQLGCEFIISKSGQSFYL